MSFLIIPDLLGFELLYLNSAAQEFVHAMLPCWAFEASSVHCIIPGKPYDCHCWGLEL